MKRGKGLKRTRKPIDVESLNKMRDFFLSIWSKRRHYSEVSGTCLGKECLTIYFHHILPKNSYPDLMYKEENIVLLTGDEHSNVENDKFRYKIINIRRNELLSNL